MTEQAKHIKPRFSIGDNVWIVRRIYVPAGTHTGSDTCNIDKIDTLYGTIDKVVIDSYGIDYTVGCTKNVPESIQSVLTKEAIRFIDYECTVQELGTYAYCRFDFTNESEVFASTDHVSALQHAKELDVQYQLKLIEQAKASKQDAIMSAKARYMAFLMRECLSFNNCYTKDEILAVAKTLETLRCEFKDATDLPRGTVMHRHNLIVDMSGTHSEYLYMIINTLSMQSELARRFELSDSRAAELADKCNALLN